MIEGHARWHVFPAWRARKRRESVPQHPQLTALQQLAVLSQLQQLLRLVPPLLRRHGCNPRCG